MRRVLCVFIAISLGLVAQLVNAKAYKGAEIYTSDSYLYGRYEIRMRVAKGSGVLSTFFTYKNGSEVGSTFWEEIDIEVFGKDNATRWQTNIILGSSRPTIHTEQTHTANVSLADDYHTYVIEWTPDYVAWFVDGVEARRIIGTSTVTSLTSAQSLRFNIWSSESVPWVGAWNDSILPVYQFVNYLEYKAYNPTTKTFEGGWRDDFNSFDSARWGKANWSFDSNRVDFVPENVVVKEGILVLALTKENATGFSGTPPADVPASSSSASSVAVSSAAPSSVAASSIAASVAASSVTAATSSVAAPTASNGGGSGGGGAINLLGLWVLAGLLLSRRRN